MDLSSFAESLQRGFGQIPPVAIALVLLAGPTLAFIGYRLISVARRWQAAPQIQAEPYWVCHDCRSINELRQPRCYRCGIARDASGQLEVILDQPTGPGVPVMADSGFPGEAIAVGPGRPTATAAVPVVAVPVVAESIEASAVDRNP